MMATETIPDPAYAATVQLHRAIVAIECGDPVGARNATHAAQAWINEMPHRTPVTEGSDLQEDDVRESSPDWMFTP